MKETITDKTPADFIVIKIACDALKININIFENNT